MENNIIAFPRSIEANDPVAERAQFFFDLEMAELNVIIPQAEAPTESRMVY